MGLNIAFNRAAAIAAGLELFTESNGTVQSIAEAHAGDDQEFLEWLCGTSEVVVVPGTELHVTNDGIGENILIRANIWGDVYAPMTAWLAANNISWEGF